MKRRIFSILTVLALCLGMLPGIAQAVGRATDESPAYTAYIKVPTTWTGICCYAYIEYTNDEGKEVSENTSWPGASMNALGGGYWKYEVPASLVESLEEHDPNDPILLMFTDCNNTSNRYPANGERGLECTGSGDWMFTYDEQHNYSWAQHGGTEHLYKDNKCVVCAETKPIDLDFSDADVSPGALETDGYHWDATAKTLTLKGAALGTVTLPGNAGVTVVTNENSSIQKLKIAADRSGYSLPANVTFSGRGELTIEGRISNGANGESLTVVAGARVTAKGGIELGEGGDSTVTVQGTLTAWGNTGSAIFAGKVVVGGTGSLAVKGKEGVLVHGTLNSGDQTRDFDGAFQIGRGGIFEADCTEFNIQVSNGYEKSTIFSRDKMDKIISLPSDYLSGSCRLDTASNNGSSAVGITNDPKGLRYESGTLVGMVHGPFVLHEDHDWAAGWKTDATHHWQECVFAGCFQTNNYSTHSYDNAADTTCDLCGYTRDVESPGHIHTWAEEYSTDVTHHWYACTAGGCDFAIDQMNGYEAHSYDGDADTTCNVCGYVRTVLPEPDHPAGSSPSVGIPSGSSGVTTYAVTVKDAAHGKVTSSHARASSNSTVTVTVLPDEGYTLDGLTVTDSQGNEISLTDRGGGKYAFTMPGGAVTVKAAFAPLPEDTGADTPCDGGAECPSRPFADLDPGAWYHEATDYVLRNGLMSGYDGHYFGPDDNLSRAQFAQLLYNKEGKPAVTGGSVFSDVADGQWYAPAVIWAASSGIVSGYDDGRFGPDDDITREQLAVMLWRYAGSPAAAAVELPFADASQVSGYALEAMRWAVENGVMGGYGNDLLGPQSPATRAQVAQMLKNFIENWAKDI